ncbi:tetratricopeptide repeat protein [Polaribacter vadi]|uniref:tetratricopeptide repeat protein n=1 Tax=Polaribacter TaxID=52959 RepID=UPI001C091524|nr:MULTISPECIES: tetratricopeptide repeat protein [Polaribacter]MBU3010097.1 tetratricopeptide repeat protein [Polaribacter vadi]MDO6739904.1 tetratricopeptide repeat protein [Polaribacter sp. 1_MG-2023]
MKKQILALSLGLMSIGMFAQKNELKAAEKAIKKNDFKTAKAAILPLESMEGSMDAKYEAKYYYLKGATYGKTNVEKAAEAYNKLFEVEKASGSSKYTKIATPKLNELILFVSEKAIKAYSTDKDYKSATKDFYLTYKLSPSDTTFLYNAAVSASLEKDYDTSLKYYNELQKLGYTGISTQYLAVNKASGATENLGTKENRNTMVKFGTYTNPTDKVSESKQPEIIKNIGYILINQGKNDEAIVVIQEARKSNPKDLNLLLNEAQLYIKLKQMDKFGELMQEAIELDPTNPSLFFNLGVVNQNEKKTEEAIKYYKKAIELKPDYGDAYMNLAVAILAGEEAIVEEMNKNLSNFKKYDELEGKQKELYREALPYLEKADELGRTEDTVKSILNIYDLLEMTEKADALRVVYKEMRGQ